MLDLEGIVDREVGVIAAASKSRPEAASFIMTVGIDMAMVIMASRMKESIRLFWREMRWDFILHDVCLFFFFVFFVLSLSAGCCWMGCSRGIAQARQRQ